MHYLNMKKKEKMVGIIDLQLGSSLKLDSVQKTGTSWDEPCLYHIYAAINFAKGRVDWHVHIVRL